MNSARVLSMLVMGSLIGTPPVTGPEASPNKIGAPPRIEVEHGGWPTRVSIPVDAKMLMTVVNTNTKNVELMELVTSNPNERQFIAVGRLPDDKTSAEYEVKIMVNGSPPDKVPPVEAASIIIAVKRVGPLPPTPDPDDNKPKPPKPPNPPSPAPIPVEGNRVMFIIETADLAKLPKEQLEIFYSPIIRDYLNKKCPVGRDNKTREWRLFDPNTIHAAEAPHWQEAWKRPRTSVPWIVVSTGKTGTEEPLPKNVNETLALLKKYFGE